MIYVIQKGPTVYACGRSPNAAWRAFGGWSRSASAICAEYNPQGYRVQVYKRVPMAEVDQGKPSKPALDVLR